MATILSFPDRFPPPGVERTTIRAEQTALSSAVADMLAELVSIVRGWPGFEPTCGLKAFDYDRYEDGVVETSSTGPPAVPSQFLAIEALHDLRRVINEAFHADEMEDLGCFAWVEIRVNDTQYGKAAEMADTTLGRVKWWLLKADETIAGRVPLRYVDRETYETLLEESLEMKLSQTVLAKELRSAGYRPELPIECFRDSNAGDGVFVAVDARGARYERREKHPKHMWMRVDLEPVAEEEE